ncbi:MAG: LamG-like jellyroll fold domain-containing protein [Saprospiraceae bacterium]
MQSCQRLLRVYPNDPYATDDPNQNVVNTLYNNGAGYTSAHQIAALSEDGFATNFPDADNYISKNLARTIHQMAVNVKQRVQLYQANLNTATATSYYGNSNVSNVPSELVDFHQSLPDYNSIFGSQPYTNGDQDLSILSPAAYFVDLMQLANNYISKPTDAELRLDTRRPDLWTIPLDANHTETEVPYLQIVNEILEQNLTNRLASSLTTGEEILQYLAQAIYPFNLPLHFPLEQIRTYLQQQNLQLVDIYGAFGLAETATTQEALRLSHEAYQVIVTGTSTESYLKKAYGLYSATSLDDLKAVAFFQAQTGLEDSALQALLYQSLNKTERENGLNAHFFVNKNFSGNQRLELLNGPGLSFAGEEDYVAIDNLIYDSATTAISIELWVKIDTTASIEMYLVSWDASKHWALKVNTDGAIVWTTHFTDGTTAADLVGSTIRDGQWHHIAAVFDGDSSTKTIYVDGVACENPLTDTPASFGTTNERYGFIGVNAAATTFDGGTKTGFASGTFSELRIWDKALSQNEVSANMYSRLTGREDLLKAYWSLTDELATEVNEFSGKNYTGNLLGNPVWENYQCFPFLELDNLSRIHRFIRLASALDWNFEGLDWALRTFTTNLPTLGADDITRLAKLKKLQAQLNQPIDVITSLWADLKTEGRGNTDQAADLYSRIFNNNNFNYYPTYTNNSLFTDTPIDWTIADTETATQRKIRSWLCGSLRISDDDLSLLAQQLVPSGTTEFSLSVPNLSRLYRFAKLPAILGRSVAEFIVLLQLKNIQEWSTLDEVMDLVEFSQWLTDQKLNAYQVQYVLTGQSNTYVNPLYSEADLSTMLTNLWATAVDWMVVPAIFQNEHINATNAALIKDQFSAEGILDIQGIFLNLELDYDVVANSLQKLFPTPAEIDDNSFVLATSDVDFVYNTLVQYLDAQLNGTMDQLAKLLGSTADVQQATTYFSAKAANQALYLQLLLSPLASTDTIAYTAVSDFIATIARYNYCFALPNLAAASILSLADHPQWLDPSLSSIAPDAAVFAFSIAQFQSLFSFQQTVDTQPFALTDFLAYLELPAGDSEKNNTLSTLMDWKITEIDLLISQFTIDSGTVDDVPNLLQFLQCFALNTQLGVNTHFFLKLCELANLSASVNTDWITFKDNAAATLQALQAKYDEATWNSNYAVLRQPLLERERDALANFLLWDLGKSIGKIKTLDDLYEFLLVDVQMAGCQNISYLKEALNCMQLYIYRCRMQLEAEVTSSISEDWWNWMSQFQLWVANRKIFLYPESYLDPALRQNKTPIFEDFQNDLLQSAITEESVEAAMMSYFDDFETIAKLRICDTYYCTLTNPADGSEEETLFIFGQTHTDPVNYYYRKAKLDACTRNVIAWEPWQSISLNINSDYLTPIYAFERLFVFWVEINTNKSSDDNTLTVTKATIKYSFQSVNLNWSQPQTLISDLVIQVTGSSYNYLESVQSVVNFDSDFTKIFWKKVYALKVPPASTGQDQILVIYGDLPSIPDTTTTITAPQVQSDSNLNTYNNMLYQTAQAANDFVETGQYGWMSFLPAISLDSGLLKTQKRIVISQGNTNTPSLVVDNIDIFSLKESGSKNSLIDNYYPGGGLVPDSYTTLRTEPEKVKTYLPLSTINSNNETPDLTQNEHNGVVNDGVSIKTTYNFPPNYNVRTVLDFDGHTGYMPIKQLDFSGLYNAAGFAVEAWINIDNTDGTMTIASFDASEYWGLFVVQGKVRWITNISSGGATTTKSSLDSITTLSPGRWYFIEAEWNGNNNKVSIYIDGILNSSETCPSGWDIGGNASPTRYGALGADSTTVDFSNYTGLNSYFKGQIAEFRIWHTHLSTTQINEDMQAFYLPELADLLTNLSPSFAALTTVKNQPDWYVFDNGTDIFLTISQNSEDQQISDIITCDNSDTNVEVLSLPIIDTTTQNSYSFTRLNTATVHSLSQKLLAGGPDQLYTIASQFTKESDFNQFLPDANQIIPPSTNVLDFNGALGIYFWEVFFHVPMLIANSLRANQQFSAAKKWYEYIFNPILSGERAIAHWPLNEDSGNTATDMMNTANGTLMVGTNESALSNWAIDTDFPLGARSVRSFDGVNDYIAIDNLCYDQVGAIENITVEAWIKLNDLATQGIIISFDQDNYWALDVGTGYKINWYTKDSTDHKDDLTTTSPLAAHVWYFITATYEAATGMKRIYVNGQLNTQVTVNKKPLGNGDTRYGFIGASSQASSFNGTKRGAMYFKGKMADVSIWNSIRTEEEIQMDMKSKSSDSYWQFAPFRGHNLETVQQMLNNPTEIKAYEDDPFDPDAIAALRIGAYEKEVVMQYIDNLLQWGDYLFTQDSWESITQATMLYVMAKDLLGDRPDLPVATDEKVIKTYAQLQTDAQHIPEYLKTLEGEVDCSKDSLLLSNQAYDVFSNYFNTPENENFTNYWDLVDDRLYKIRHCMNIDGQVQDLALFQPPIDPNQLIAAQAMGGSATSAAANMATDLPVYRFSFLIREVKNLIGQLNSFGGALLSALEKKDAETLSVLRATNELNILNLTTLVKQNQIDQLAQTKLDLQASLDSAQQRVDTYGQYLDDGLSANELLAEVLTDTAIISQTIVADGRLLAAVPYMFPNTFGLADGGMEFGKAFEAANNFLEGLVGVMNAEAQLATTMGQYDRRNDDWTLQKTLAEYDVQQINARLAGNVIQQASAQQELSIHQKNIAQSQEVDDFLNSKFTNQDLYQWMVNKISSVYFQCYNMAFNMALSAEKAYQFELGKTDTYIRYGSWDSLHQGLLCGELLMYNVEQLNIAYLNNNTRTLEIEKTVSLLQLDPMQFFTLKTTGSCNFNLDEILFDYDFPGHYYRCIKSISISIPAIVGPYQNVQASLIQNTNKVILQPDLNTVQFLLGDSEQAPDSSNLRNNWKANQQIAISKGVKDSGLFQLNFNDERYLPFEGTGAVSSWTLQMPKATNRINFDSISDVIINLQYTALTGDESFRQSVIDSPSLSNYAGTRYLSLQQAYSADWYAFKNPAEGITPAPMKIKVDQSLFPFNLEEYLLGNANGAINLLVVTTDGIQLSSSQNDFGDISLNAKPSQANPAIWDNSSMMVRLFDGADTPKSLATALETNWEIQVKNIAEVVDIILIIPYRGPLSW